MPAYPLRRPPPPPQPGPRLCPRAPDWPRVGAGRRQRRIQVDQRRHLVQSPGLNQFRQPRVDPAIVIDAGRVQAHDMPVEARIRRARLTLPTAERPTRGLVDFARPQAALRVGRMQPRGDNWIKRGEFVMEGLKALDSVAYIRFASVYKDFSEAKDFEDFAGSVVEAAQK